MMDQDAKMMWPQGARKPHPDGVYPGLASLSISLEHSVLTSVLLRIGVGFEPRPIQSILTTIALGSPCVWLWAGLKESWGRKRICKSG